MSTEKVNSHLSLTPKHMLTAVQQVIEARLVPYVIGSPGVYLI